VADPDFEGIGGGNTSIALGDSQLFHISQLNLIIGLDDLLSRFSELLEGDDMTGKQAALIVAVWMGATALFGIISYILVFVIMRA